MNTQAPISGVSFKHASLRSLLNHQARLRPDDIAVTAAGGDLTFHELTAEADRLGSRLTALGVAPDTCVGLYTEPSTDLVTGVWGILTAGAAYLPLSPDYPEARLRYMVENACARVIVTQPHLRDRLLHLVPDATVVFTLEDCPPDGVPVPQAEAQADHLAYVIHTSGSTGKPKGVMIEQRSIVSQLRWLEACGHLGPGVSILQKTPMSFDAAQWEILACAVGARVVMGTPGLYRDPEGVITAIAEHRVTALQGVPTLLQALVDTEQLGSCASLTRVFSGGEALTRALAQDLFRALPGVSLVNLYGPTETTINATSYWVDPETLGESSPAILPIGVPADNVTCYILDADRRPVDIGESGELFVGGVQVARGYIGLPDVTAERFLTSPFNPTEQGSILRQPRLRHHPVLRLRRHRPRPRRTRLPATGHGRGLLRLLRPRPDARPRRGHDPPHHPDRRADLRVRVQLPRAAGTPDRRTRDDLQGARRRLLVPGKQLRLLRSAAPGGRPRRRPLQRPQEARRRRTHRPHPSSDRSPVRL
ncbi:amino acid adenylation domain-containing protein [Streptomyces sp. NPDC007189]|uniref:amino acid adenylation domain-containing protein n=1 Tax=Streptomyces sp. NPDC007189 TaxID=3154315 RepID=UPI0034545DA5